VHSTLQLEGYPPLSVQKQYMKDLKEIDWDAVEDDLEALMTDSQDCKCCIRFRIVYYCPILISFDLTCYQYIFIFSLLLE
jgi:catalase (peroxidase I)